MSTLGRLKRRTHAEQQVPILAA
jgi:hypothetical protein